MKKLLLSLSVASLLLSGCATLSLETKVKMTRSVFLKPGIKKTIFISVKNITGSDDLKILPILKQNLIKKGYVILENSNDANYVLMINILFANNLKEANALKASLGAGLTGGFGAIGSGASGSDSLLVGAAFALAGGLVGKAMEDETYRAVVDVVVDEKSDDLDNKSTMGSDYKEHKTRVLAEAVKTNLKLDEALPILTQKVANQISNIF